MGLGKHVWDVASIPQILDQVSKLVLVSAILSTRLSTRAMLI